MLLLEVEPLDLGPDVKAIGLELTDPEMDGEPIRGKQAAQIWSRVLPSVAANEAWALDFFSHLDRVRSYCETHHIEFRQASAPSIVIADPQPADLETLLQRFEAETFGARAGALVSSGDSAIEGDLARTGVDAYQHSFGNYLFCAICDFENGSLVLLSAQLWASEVIRRIRPVLNELEVRIQLPI